MLRRTCPRSLGEELGLLTADRCCQQRFLTPYHHHLVGAYPFLRPASRCPGHHTRSSGFYTTKPLLIPSDTPAKKPPTIYRHIVQHHQPPHHHLRSPISPGTSHPQIRNSPGSPRCATTLHPGGTLWSKWAGMTTARRMGKAIAAHPLVALLGGRALPDHAAHIAGEGAADRGEARSQRRAPWVGIWGGLHKPPNHTEPGAPFGSCLCE